MRIFALERSQRELLVAQRICSLRRPSRKLMFARARADIAEALTGKVGLFWVDNYNRVHFRHRPTQREAHVNGTAVAAIAALGAVPVSFEGFPSLPLLVRRVNPAVAELRSLEADFAFHLVNKLTTLDPSIMRVPCDVFRRGVQAADWWPYDVQPLNISTSEGLVDVLVYVKSEADRLGLLMSPILCDVNIFWRIARFLFSASYVHLDLHSALHSCPVVFGIWHCYVHCVKRVWAVFRPWWEAAENPVLLGSSPEDAKCYDFPALISLEHTVLALAVHGPSLKQAITTARHDVAISHDIVRKEHILMLLDMLQLFLCEYAPCLFYLGTEVRHCYWLGRDRWTGSTVKPLLGKFVIFLSKLSWDTPSAFEYCRSALLAYVGWTPLHDELPAAYHVEECLEASLSRLAAISRHSQHLEHEADLAMLYCSTCKASRAYKDVVKPGVSQKFVADIGLRLPSLLAACKSGDLPFVPPKTAGHRSCGSRIWPSTPLPLPLRLTVAEGALNYSTLFLRSLSLVTSTLTQASKPMEVGFFLSSKLCLGLQPVGVTQRRLRILAMEELNAKLKLQKAGQAAAKKPRLDIASSSTAVAGPTADEPDRDVRVFGDLPEDVEVESVHSDDSREVMSEVGDLDEYVVTYIDLAESNPIH